MTNQEAIKKLEKSKKAIQGISFDYIVIDLAINALDKQIPKKPITVDSGVNDYPFDHECPNCRNNVDELDHHCECGQAIDWEVEE